MKALVIGATGATGKDLVKQLLEDTSFTEVHIFVRRKTEFSHSKLKTHIVDFNQPEEWKNLITGDVAFSCLGTTIQAAKTQENQWRIDYDYQYEFAENARNNGVERYVLVSSQMADASARSFYLKMKGQLDDAVKKLDFKSTVILRPGVLDRENSDRLAEKWGVKIIKLFNNFGLFKSQKPMLTPTLAKAMINLAKNPPKERFSIISLTEIFDYAK